jgi:bacillithiol biosynthesis cysteine-adding enzyme BshC
MGEKRMKARDVPFDRVAGRSFFTGWIAGAPPAREALPGPACTLEQLRPAAAAARAVPERGDLAREIHAYLEAAGAPEPALANAARLADPSACVVLAGQQPALGGGPLFNLYKAASALRLAAAVEEATGSPCVPVFWNHSEDDDLAEANHFHAVNENLDVVRIGVPAPAARMLRAWDLEAGALESAREAFLETARGPDVSWIDAVAFPREGRTLAQTFARFLLATFGERGLVAVEPHLFARRGADRLAACVERPAALERALREGAERVRRAGFEPSVSPEQTPLFRLGEGRRLRLRLSGDRFVPEGGATGISGADLARAIRREPEAFGVGVLLRPVLARAVLPVAASIGGPTEIAYHAQLPPLFDLAGLPPPAAHPRSSLTLLETRVASLLSRFALAPEDSLLSEEKLLERIPVPRPEGVDRALDRLAREARETLASVEPEVAAIDSTLVGPLRRSAQRLAEGFEELRGRIDRAHANRSGITRRHVKRASTLLLPRGEIQERGLGAAWMLARFGPTLLPAILAACDPFVHAHRFLWLDDPSDDPGAPGP